MLLFSEVGKTGGKGLFSSFALMQKKQKIKNWKLG